MALQRRLWSIFSAAFVGAAFVILCRPALSADSAQNFFYLDEARTEPLPSRWTDATKDMTVQVFVDGCVYNKIEIEEKERYTRLYTDLQLLVKRAVAQVGLEKECKPHSLKSEPVKLKFTRSTLTVTATGADAKDTTKFVVTAGPADHLYIGLDLPVSNRKALKYDSATKSLLPQDTNSQLYMSFNYLLGDLSADQDTLKGLTWERISIKGFVLVDKRPLDSVGVGLGYQLPKFNSIDLSAINIFGGRFWYKQDGVSNGMAQLNNSTGRDWRVGITFDLGTGLKWIK